MLYVICYLVYFVLHLIKTDFNEKIVFLWYSNHRHIIILIAIRLWATSHL
jgi:hypothetical protein